MKSKKKSLFRQALTAEEYRESKEAHAGRAYTKRKEKFTMRQFILALVLVTMQYTCSTNDTLQSVAKQYCQGNDPKQVSEFREGIRELNYDVIGESEVWAGLILKINRWE